MKQYKLISFIASLLILYGTAVFAAWPDDWGRKVVNTIPAANIGSNVTDFPFLITQANLPNEMIDSDEANKAQADGGDIRIYKGDYSASNPATEDTDRIPVQIVTFTQDSNPANAVVEIWSAMDMSSTADNKYTIFYNATGKSQPAATATYGSEDVWNANYMGVWHYDEASGNLLDSTSNSNDGIPSGSPTYSASGKIGDALSFDGTNDYVDAPGREDIDYTIIHWVYSGDVSLEHVSSIQESPGSGTADRDLYFDSNNKAVGRIWDGAEKIARSTTSISVNTWYRLAHTADGTNLKIYVNGTNEATTSAGNPYTGYTTPRFVIGYSKTDVGVDTMDDAYFVGRIQKTFLLDIALSADWLSAEYNNQNNPGTWQTEGTPGDVGGSPPPPRRIILVN